MKKRTSNVSRRIVSLLMSMVLTLTLVTPAAFATEVVDGSGTTIVEGNTNPADTNTSGDSEGKNDVDKDTEDGGDEQPTNPGDEDKNPNEGDGEDAVNEPSNEADTQEGEGTDTPVVAQRTVTVEKYRTDAAYDVKIVVGVEEDGSTEKLDTTYTINADTKTVTLKLTTDGYKGEPIYIKTGLDDVLVTEGENQTPKTPALTKDNLTLEYTLPEDGDVTLYYGTQADFVSAWYTSVTDDKYTIRTAGELAYFAQLVNGGNDFSGKTVTLARDIDLSAVCYPADEESDIAEVSWTPIGNAENKLFKGEFDGCNYTINNLYVTQGTRVGLFGCVNGTIKNTTVSGTVSGDGGAYAGGVVGSLNGGSVENCTNNATVDVGSNGYAGGIVGKVGKSGNIVKCQNKAKISGTYAGGIIGAIDQKISPNDVTIGNCLNTGAVTASSEQPVGAVAYAGGIVGYVSQGLRGKNQKNNLNNCRNEGEVTVTVPGTGSMFYAGGIAGYGISIKEGKNLSNTGSVTNESGAAAGLVAFISDKGSVTNSYNHGNVTGAEGAEGKVFGLCGKNVTNSYYICKINSDDTVDMKYINKAEQDITYEEAAHTYKVGEDTLVKTLNENRGSDDLKWLVNIPKGITKPIFVKLWDGTDHPDYVPDGTEKDVYVTYDPNGGSGGKTVAVTVTLNEDGTVKTPGSHTVLTEEDAGVEKDSCELKDWNVEANGEGTTYTIGQDVSVSEDMTLYAQWQLLWKGSGTESDPYQIETEADWLKMQKYAKRYSNYPDMWFALMDDITLDNYEPFFFRGNLMGNGNTITVDVPGSIETGKHTRGLFSSIIGGDAGIRIENLTVAGSVTAYSGAGGLAGNITGKVTLENVTNNVSVKAGGYQYDTTSSAGGLCASYSGNTLTVKNCVNNGSVTAYQAAGFVAKMSGSTTMSFSGCRNTGTITGKGAYSDGYAAGLVSIYHNAYNLTCTFENCANSGTISANARAAGIAINCRLAANCTNSGTISGNIAGGILESGAVKYSTNTGEINGKSCAAGIASAANTGAYTVEFCANFGKITATAGSGAAKPAYGIASQGTVKNCFTYNETYVPVAGNTTGRNCVVTNSYYLASSATEFPSTMGGEYATLADFTSGKVAWGVDGGTGAHANYWTQGANNYPAPIGEGTSTSYYRAKAECGTGGAVSIKSSRNFTGDADNAVYGPKGMSVTVTATPKDNNFGLKSLTLDLMGTGSTTALESGDSFTLGEANALVVAAFASTGNGGNGGGNGGNGGNGDGTGTDTGDGAGDEDDEGLQDGLNLEVEYDVKGLILSAYGAWGAEGSGKTFAQWLKDSPEVLRALITNSLDNMAVAAMGKKTDEARDLAALLLASLNEHSGLDGQSSDTIAKMLRRYIESGTEAAFSAWLTTGGGMASGTYESIFAQYTNSLLALADRLYTNWESSGTSLTFPQWLDAQQVTMESLSENAEEPDAEPDDTQTSEAPEDVPDGQEAEGGASSGGNSVWEVIGTVVRENPIIVWSIVAVIAALIIVGAVRRYHKVKRDERDDVSSKK